MTLVPEAPNPSGIIDRRRRSFIAGGAAGNLTVTGISLDDKIIQVIHIALSEGAPNTFDAPADLTSEFSITAANTINNTGGTATTDGLVIVEWYDADWGFTSNV